MSLTKSATEPGGRLASYVDRIVEDEKPAGLPCGLSRSTARRRHASRTPPRHVARSAGRVLPTTLAVRARFSSVVIGNGTALAGNTPFQENERDDDHREVFVRISVRQAARLTDRDMAIGDRVRLLRGSVAMMPIPAVASPAMVCNEATTTEELTSNGK